MMKRPGLLALLLLASAGAAQAQLSPSGSGFGAECAASNAREYCGRVAEAVQVLQPRIGVALSGGNPVPGTASTIGMRLGASPRISLGVRASAAAVKIGGIERAADDDQMTFAVPALAIDASVGVFSGLTLAPTLGGFGSVDLLASFGTIPLPDGKGFDSSPTSWSAGARVGLLRESFLAPGVSVSAMYRRMGDVEYGVNQNRYDAFFRMEDLSGWALRAAVGKRLLGFGLTGGAGYDRYTSDVNVRIGQGGGAAFELSAEDLVTSRSTLFGNASLTFLILHLVGEIGWQSGGDPDGSAQISTDYLDRSALYGGLAVRVSL